MTGRRTVTIDDTPHVVIPHDHARSEYVVSASDQTTGAFYLCSTRPGALACTCKRGQFGFRTRTGTQPCRHVRAALAAEALDAAASLAVRDVRFGPVLMPDPFT